MTSPLQAMRDLLVEDTRFPLDAYQFVRESLQYAHENLADEQDLAGSLDHSADAETKDDDAFGDTELPNPKLPDSELLEVEVDVVMELPEELRDQLEALGSELIDNASNKQPVARSRHITGQDLCEACRLYAIEQYGFLAKIVLETWGIRSTGDFGELVYNLIRIGQMKQSDRDRREDFDEVYEFATAFDPHFEMAIGNDAF